jgi:BirA family transcriptional regulator, biotin operon repressor / biotin---[acetyl-CoA-carboxylase] ligase
LLEQVFETLKRKNILYHITLPSTQLYAQGLLSKIKPIEGTAILTYNQADGKGQLGAKWLSEPEKNICVSFIYYPDFIDVHKQFIISKAFALAVRELVESIIHIPVYIKWPNDIIVNNSKIAGILINNAIQGDKLVNSIIGIGLNVNQTSFPPEAGKATSIKMISHEDTDLEDLVMQLKDTCIKYYQKLINQEWHELDQLYLQYLYGLNTSLQFIGQDGKVFHGSIVGIEENACLLVKTNEGQKSFSIKQIKLVL